MNQPANQQMSAADVAQYILRRLGPMPQLKLQKLLYYCQAATLAWTGDPLFLDRIEAWANGPVVVSIWNENQYQQWVVPGGFSGDPNLVTGVVQSYVDTICNFYGGYSGFELSSFTHNEKPWQSAREGIADGAHGHRPIDLAEMRDFYRKAWA